MTPIKLFTLILLLTSCRIYIVMPNVDEPEVIQPQHEWYKTDLLPIYDTLIFDGDTLVVDTILNKKAL